MRNREFKFNIGDKLRDKVTGFEGICTSRADHISGCDTFGVQPQTLKDGAPQETKWFDEPRLVLVQAEAIFGIDTREDKTGADGVPQPTNGIPR